MSKIEKLEYPFSGGWIGGFNPGATCDKINEIIDHINGEEECTCSEAGSRTCTEHQSTTPEFVLTDDEMIEVDECTVRALPGGYKAINHSSIKKLYKWEWEFCTDLRHREQGRRPDAATRRHDCMGCQDEFREYVEDLELPDEPDGGWMNQ